MRQRLVVCAFVTLAVTSAFAQQPPATPAPTKPAPATVAATAPAPIDALHDNDAVAICGDSITQQKLYSVYMEDYLLMCKPKSNVHAMQFGWDGEVVGGFLGRMSNVLRFPVTVATTFYGMNDGGYAALTDEKAKKYRDGTKAIVDTFKQSGDRCNVVGSPGVVDSKTFKPADPDADKVYNKTLGQLGDIAAEVAKSEGVAYTDVHGLMMDVMAKAKAKYGEDYPVTGAHDGVHPDPNGHLVIAYAFLKALGCDGNIGTINVDLTGNKATATDGHKILAMKDGSVDVESARYPFCFTGDPKSPDATTGIIEFLPFNQDLNRYTLIVANPPAGTTKLKITWGKQSKEFPIADLAKGINLAAEFLDNPFAEPFKKVQDTIAQQQQFETLLVKQLLASLPQYAAMVPQQKDAASKFGQAGIDLANAMNNNAVASVAPVKHTIKIEAVK